MAALWQAVLLSDRLLLADSANWRSNFQEASASGKSPPTAVTYDRQLCDVCAGAKCPTTYPTDL
jgi:hypothetical protein